MYSIDKSLAGADVDFYLFHRGLDGDDIAGLYGFSSLLTNLRFHDVVVKDIDKYDYIASYGGGWAGEAYYSLCAHEYLPQDVDRVMYLDAGDLIVVGDIDDFYSADFEDNVILASNIRLYIDGQPVIFESEDELSDENKMLQILDSTFNSGSYMLNLDKLRRAGLTIDDYVSFTNMFLPLADVMPQIYFGDQGFLSACFLGDIKYYGYPKEPNLITTAFNFTMGWYNIFDHEPDFEPAVIHYAGAAKPWQVKSLSELKPRQVKWYELWIQYSKHVEGMRCSLSI